MVGRLKKLKTEKEAILIHIVFCSSNKSTREICEHKIFYRTKYFKTCTENPFMLSIHQLWLTCTQLHRFKSTHSASNSLTLNTRTHTYSPTRSHPRGFQLTRLVSQQQRSDETDSIIRPFCRSWSHWGGETEARGWRGNRCAPAAHTHTRKTNDGKFRSTSRTEPRVT